MVTGATSIPKSRGSPIWEVLGEWTPPPHKPAGALDVDGVEEEVDGPKSPVGDLDPKVKARPNLGANREDLPFPEGKGKA